MLEEEKVVTDSLGLLRVGWEQDAEPQTAAMRLYRSAVFEVLIR